MNSVSPAAQRSMSTEDTETNAYKHVCVDKMVYNTNVFRKRAIMMMIDMRSENI